MNHSPLTPEKPDKVSIAAVDATPFWRSKTTWSVVLAVLAAAPVFADQFRPLLTEKQAAGLTAVAAVLAGLAGIFARSGGVSAAAVAHEKAEGVGPNG